jgi:myosin-crossreactive antigen
VFYRTDSASSNAYVQSCSPPDFEAHLEAVLQPKKPETERPPRLRDLTASSATPSSHQESDAMISTSKAYFIGGGIGSLAAAAFLIRDGGMPGANIRVLEAGRVMGGSLDGAGDAERGYSMRGGRMLTTDNYECTWDLFKSIPSLAQPGRSVFDETLEFNEKHVSNAMARLVDSRRAKVPVASMGFSMHDRVELLKLANADESTLGTSCITDHLSPAFFQTEFWFMWVTTFAFQPWHSAVEFRRVRAPCTQSHATELSICAPPGRAEPHRAGTLRFTSPNAASRWLQR